jgi:hypothetical protein
LIRDLLQEINELVFPIHDRPFGLSYGDWTVKWWKWILQIPKSINPLFDKDGKNAYLNQIHGKVFFLCQTLESSGKFPLRTVKIPKESSIFMPVINWVSVLGEDGETDEQLLRVARQRMDVVKDLHIHINKIALTTDTLKKFRTQSPFMDVLLPENNIFGQPSGQTRMVSDGYWIFLRPISDSIRIKSLGSCSSGITKIGVDYNINIF